MSPGGPAIVTVHSLSTAERVTSYRVGGAGSNVDRMSIPELPDPSPFASSAASAASVVTVGDPGELIAAVPALLGFRPRSSLVAMALGGASGARLGLTLRIDLPPPEHIAEAADSVVHGVLLDDPVGAVVLVIGPGGDAGPPAAPLVQRVVAGLEARDVDVPLALWTQSTDGGSRWSCYDACACGGIVPGGRDTPLVVAAVAEGRVVRADRAELEQLVAPADETRIRRREALLVTAIDAECRGDHPIRGGIGALDSDPADEVVRGIAALDTAFEDVVAALAAGDVEPVLDDEPVLALARAFQSPMVREAAIASCTGSRPAAAEALWAALSRETPDPEAAEPAALLALSALLRGDGALANIALDRAEAAWPGHRLTATLRGLAAAGTRPSELRAALAGRGLPSRPPRRRP